MLVLLIHVKVRTTYIAVFNYRFDCTIEWEQNWIVLDDDTIVFCKAVLYLFAASTVY